MQIINYMPGYWSVSNENQTVGWIRLDQVPYKPMQDTTPASGKYIASRPVHGFGGHKGGHSFQIGVFDTLEQAQAAIEAA